MIVSNEQEMLKFGERVGVIVRPGDIIELIGDVGAGKTTFVRGLAKGMAIDETIQSPSFTINKSYESPDGLLLAHYDFYRLSEPGIMADELAGNVANNDTVVVVEWAAVVDKVLPKDKLSINIRPDAENHRIVEIGSAGEKSGRLHRELE